MTTLAGLADIASLCCPGQNQRGLFTESTVESAVPISAGIYRVYAHDLRLLYVGQAHDLRERLLYWRREKRLDMYTPWYFEYELCPASLLDPLEAAQILLLKPALNIQRPLG